MKRKLLGFMIGSLSNAIQNKLELNANKMSLWVQRNLIVMIKVYSDLFDNFLEIQQN